VGHPSFSIVVPTYQRRELVCETLRALAGIEYGGSFETIVVVDGSTDGTAAALARLECPFPVKVVEQDNRGLAAARNRGAAEAGGDIVLFLDDDMIVRRDVLEQHAHSYGEGADAVVGAFIEPGSPPKIYGGASTDGDGGAVASPFGLFGGHMSVRRSAFENVNGFDESFTEAGKYGYEDFDLAHRLMQRFSVHRNPRAISYHRKAIESREQIRRARSCADAELHFVAKHPELRDQLVEWTGASRISGRMRLLSGIPVLPHIIAQAAALLVEIGARTPFRSSRALQYFGRVAFSLTYWSRIRRKARTSGL
jgi:glycosyltransferase involved in cell wall biosynthesis